MQRRHRCSAGVILQLDIWHTRYYSGCASMAAALSRCLTAGRRIAVWLGRRYGRMLPHNGRLRERPTGVSLSLDSSQQGGLRWIVKHRLRDICCKWFGSHAFSNWLADQDCRDLISNQPPPGRKRTRLLFSLSASPPHTGIRCCPSSYPRRPSRCL